MSDPKSTDGAEFERALLHAETVLWALPAERHQEWREAISAVRAANLAAVEEAGRRGLALCANHDGEVFNRPAGVCAGCLIAEAAHSEGRMQGLAIVKKYDEDVRIEAARQAGAAGAWRAARDVHMETCVPCAQKHYCSEADTFEQRAAEARKGGGG